MLMLRRVWRALATNKVNTKENMFVNCILRAQTSKLNVDKVALACRLLQKSFTPVTCKIKLANGRWRWDTISHIVNAGTFAGYAHQAMFLCLETEQETAEFKQLVGGVMGQLDLAKANKSDHFDKPYTYIFVRQDISKEQQLVQTSHVTLKLGVELGFQKSGKFDDLHFVVIGVKDLDKLVSTEVLLSSNNIDHVKFIEPDIGNQLTAIATKPITSITQRRLFSNYKLLSFNNL